MAVYNALAYGREYREKNRAELNAKARAFYWANREKKLAAGKQYKDKNRHTIRAQDRKRYAENRVAMVLFRETNRDRLVARRYRMEVEDYKKMLREHRGRCGACGSKSKLCLDHDHKTDAARGLLCNSCNVTLGQVQDSPARLLALVKYLWRTTR
jgi:hypothetical protein